MKKILRVLVWILLSPILIIGGLQLFLLWFLLEGFWELLMTVFGFAITGEWQWVTR